MNIYLNKNIPHMPLSEFGNDSKSVWAKYLQKRKILHIMKQASGGSSEEFQQFHAQLDHIRTKHKGNKFPSIHVLDDFNFKDIARSD